MSIVSMKKMSLAAHRSERSRLLKLFMKSGCVELTQTEIFDGSSYPTGQDIRQALESKRLKVGFALTFLREMTKEMKRIDKEKKLKANFKKENRLIPLEEYETAAEDEFETFSKIAELEKINAQLVDFKSEKARLTALKEQLAVYLPLPIPFAEIKDTQTTFMLAGIIPANKADEVTEKIQSAVVYFYPGDKFSCVVTIGHKDDKKEVQSLLSTLDFIPCTFDDSETATQITERLTYRETQLEEARVRQVESAIAYLPLLAEFKILFDFYNLELAKTDVVANCPHTQKAFVMEGWVPSSGAEELEKEVKQRCKRVEIFFRDPFDDEIPPTQTHNAKPIAAFNGITEMFGAPNYRGQDPNLFVALFYFMFFGIMISDAGYGLLMAIACFGIVKLTKPVKNSGRMLIMFGFCGISTVIWGTLFGGWFGIQNIGVLAKLQWFNPLDDPLKMFMLALGMGVLQIGTGFMLKGIALCKERHPIYAIFNQFSWVIIFLGLLLISPNLMLFLGAIKTNPAPAWFGVCAQIGMYVALGGFVMLLIGGAIGKKNPLKMAGGAFKNAYGAINVVSDLLSYSRLFGLGLTTGVIGYVINMLADIIVNTFLGGLWVGWIIAVPVLVIGHTFNIAINLLGAYVHNSRLQYIEFFGRFYEGNGRAFKPFGTNTHYTYLDN